MLHTYLTFTVAVPIDSWMHSRSPESVTLFMAFLDDVAESLPIVHAASSCYITGKAELWYTFFDEADKNVFLEAVEKLWLEGGFSNEQ